MANPLWIPVVLVTGMGAREHRIAGIHAGADDFITKPFDAEELQARVASLLRLKQYTDELSGDEIPVLAEIVGIVDTFDAVTTTRPYRKALPDDAAFEELLRDAARGAFRQDFVDRFISLRRDAGRAV